MTRVFPSHKERLLTAAIVTFFAGLTLGILGGHYEKYNNVFVGYLTTVGAAFFGAWFAFRLQNNHEKQKIRQQQLSAGNRAILTLSQRYSFLHSYRKSHLLDEDGEQRHFVLVRATLPIEPKPFQLDMSSLYFLLETEYRALLNELYMEELRFKSTIEEINARSTLDLNQVQPRMEDAGIHHGVNFTEQDVEKALGPRILVTIKQATEHLQKNVPLDMKETQTRMKKLTEVFKQLFPGEPVFTTETKP